MTTLLNELSQITWQSWLLVALILVVFALAEIVLMSVCRFASEKEEKEADDVNQITGG
jgi:phosphate starvation-inducible membrane PsiE